MYQKKSAWVPYTYFDGLGVAIQNMSEKKIAPPMKRSWDSKSNLGVTFFFVRGWPKWPKLGAQVTCAFFGRFPWFEAAFFLKFFGFDPAFGGKKSEKNAFFSCFGRKKGQKFFGRLRRPIFFPSSCSCFFVENFRFHPCFFLAIWAKYSCFWSTSYKKKKKKKLPPKLDFESQERFLGGACFFFKKIDFILLFFGELGEIFGTF